jgi:hypothetical protein
MNTVLRQLHPYVDKAVGDIVHEKLGAIFGGLALKKFGIASIALEHFSLGPPPKITGIKAWCAAALGGMRACMRGTCCITSPRC